MARETLEATIARLEEKCNRIEELERQVERLKAINEIQNLMSRYEYLHLVSDHAGVIELYAKKQADVFVNIGVRGHWFGKDAPRRAWENFIRLGRNPGELFIHPITTSVIEVAGDCQTAKGIWIGMGLDASKNQETGKGQCTWEWDRYGVDFIKEDGKWKFWHFHIYRLFRCGWDDKWDDQFSMANDPVFEISYTDETKPDGPPIASNPYRLDTLIRLVPAPPEPYEKWSDDNSYGKPAQ